MRKKYEALHVTYVQHQGQVPTFGGSPEIANALESLGTGMEVSSPWERGGPIVWRPLNERRFVGWMQGIQTSVFGRQGAWECRGLLVDDDVDISAWPWLLKKMRQSNTEGSLDELGQLLLKRQGEVAPDQASELATVLTALYRQRRAGDSSPMTIPMDIPMHTTALLPWVWLLGPFDPQQAYLGPPRRTLAATSPALVYHPTIGAPFTPAIQLPSFMDSLKKQMTLESAIQLGKYFRDPKTKWWGSPQVAELPQRQVPLSREDAPADKEEKARAYDGVSRYTKLLAPLRAKRHWLRVLPWALVIFLLLYITQLLRPIGPIRDDITDIRNTVHSASSPLRKTAAAKSALGLSGQATPTATESAITTSSVTANPTQPALDIIRETITRGVPGVTFSDQMKKMAKGKPNVSDSARLHIAALQTVFFKRNWTTDPKIDGIAGNGFFAAMKNRGSADDLVRLLTDDQYLLVELQKR